VSKALRLCGNIRLHRSVPSCPSVKRHLRLVQAHFQERLVHTRFCADREEWTRSGQTALRPRLNNPPAGFFGRDALNPMQHRIGTACRQAAFGTSSPRRAVGLFSQSNVTRKQPDPAPRSSNPLQRARTSASSIGNSFRGAGQHIWVTLKCARRRPLPDQMGHRHRTARRRPVFFETALQYGGGSLRARSR